MDLKEKIRVIEDFPKEGISFKDITTLIKDPKALRYTINHLVIHVEDDVDYVVGPEARGFIFGTAVAYQLGIGFIPVRKPGKLPGDVVSIEYELEYGTDKIEITKDALKPGDKVVLVDDLLATGGSFLAAAKAVEALGGEVVKIVAVMELTDLKGRENLSKYNVESLVQYDN